MKEIRASRSKWLVPEPKASGEENKSACDSDLTKSNVMWPSRGIHATTVAAILTNWKFLWKVHA